MLVNIHLRQGTHVDLKLIFCRKRIGQGIIQAVDAFDDQYIFRSQLQAVALIFFRTGNKIKSRHIHFFSPKKCAHLLIKQLNIHSFQTFKIVLSILILWCIHAFHKIIVHCDRMRLQTMCHQLNGKTMRKCGLS